jgi:protein phosphatase
MMSTFPSHENASFTIQAAGKTDVGMVRRENEDAFGCFPEIPFYAVADGMGGHAAGGTASVLAIATLYRVLTDSSTEDLTPVLDSHGHCSVGGRLLTIALYHANEQVLQASRTHAGMRGMGTTVAALLFDRRYDVAAICHVGDSRIYRIRGAAIEQLTEDHTLVRQLVRDGRMSPGEVSTSPHRHILTQAVGIDDVVHPHLRLERPLPRDLFVLCSDGIHDSVRAEEILDVVRDAGDALDAACARLIDLANERGGADNSTVVIVRCQDERDAAAATHAHLGSPE